MEDKKDPISGTRETWRELLEQLAETAKDSRLKAFYQAGCVEPDTPLADAPLVALDFETTGLNPDEHSIVSIGLVPFSLSGIQVGKGRHWVVRPQLPLEQTSITIHGITHTDIDKAPDLGEVLEEILQALAGRIVVVHYRSIERPFFNVALQWRLNEGIRFPVIDTMAIEAHLHPNRRPTRWQKFRGIKPVSIRLADSRTRYGLPHYPPHNALIDAIATAELLQAQIHYHFSPDTAVKDLWL
ncbi:MAG: 3'-5' exonuclease [Marinobacter sp.]